MYRHRHFNLWLHDDKELVSPLQSHISERLTLHEWPLSCVQRLTTSDGRKVIYKTQFGPTVESAFYANARSDLLPLGKTIYECDGHVCMLFEFVEEPLIEDLDLSEEEAVRIGRAVMEQIAAIPGELPHFVDVSTEEKWGKLITATLKDIEALTGQGKLNLVDGATVRSLERWAFSNSVLSAIRANPGTVHGDLSGDNLFVLPDGYRLIDWQRPMLGPADLNLAHLLHSLGFHPSRHVDEGIVRVMYFLWIHWIAQCATRWIPQAIKTYDKHIVQLASLMDGSLD